MGRGLEQLKGVRGLIISALIYLALGFGCIAFAMEIVADNVWHDALLVVGGILLGGLCAMATLIKMELAKQGGKG